VYRVRNMGSPHGGDPYGDGDPIVVSERESRSQGEGGQVAKGTLKRTLERSLALEEVPEELESRVR